MWSTNVNVAFEDKKDAWVALGLLQSAIGLPRFQSATYTSSGITEISEEVGKNPGFVDETWHDDKTMMKVLEVMAEWVSDTTALKLVEQLQDAGFLFREKLPE